MENQTLMIKPETQPKSFPMVLILGIFIILSLCSVAFLWYQNQQLKKIILSYQQEIQPSPTPVATTDPTSDWKIYTDKQSRFQFKYPATFKLRSTPSQLFEEESLVIDDKTRINFLYRNGENTSKFGLNYYNIQKYEKNGIKIESATYIDQYNGFPDSIYIEGHLNIDGVYAVLKLSTIKNEREKWEPIFDQILSTFKFLDDSVVSSYTDFASKAKRAQPVILVTKTLHYNIGVKDCALQPITENCFVGSTSWGQPEKIKVTILDGRSAISYYLNDPIINEPIHILETTSPPFVQIAQVVGGSGLDESFNQFVSTFKITN